MWNTSLLRGTALIRGLALLLVLAATGCGNGHVYPGESWERVSRPEAAGWATEGLERVREQLSTMGTDGLMAVVGGRVLMEYGSVDTVSYLASVRKSVLSMLYGIYVDRGAIRLDKTLAEMAIDDHQGLTDQEKQATIHDIIAARSGVYHPASNSGDDLGSAPPRGSQLPGEYYLYSNWDFNVAGTIFEQETGKNLFDAVEEHLAIPLGFQDFDRERHQKGGNLRTSMHPSYHMHFSTRDMARIGYLMLREGRWKKEQIIPAEWVARSTALITPRTEMNPARRRNGPYGYGYMWWIFDNPELLPAEFEGGYIGLGAVGQHIMVLPKLDLVVTHKTVPGGRSVSHDQFLQVARLLVAARCPDGVCR